MKTFRENTTKKKNKYTVLGVCAGQGALLMPFRKALIGNIEPRTVFHTKNEEQWVSNFGDIPFYKGYELPECNPDIIVSSPDCGASSIMRLSKKKSLGKPQENKSIELVIRAIKQLKPKYFLIENLPRLLSFIPINYLTELFKDYRLVVHQVSVSEFGNSQVSRTRLVIVGINRNLRNSKTKKEHFKKLFKVKDLKCTDELLHDIDDVNNYSIPNNKALAMYDYRRLPEKKNLTVQKIHKLWNSDFKGEKKWPIKTKKMNTLPGVYRLEGNKPPLTVRPADRQFRPDGWPLGIKDFKSIMGFPDKFKIYMPENPSDKEYLYWLNKARYTIAKGSVYEVGLWFKKCLKM